EEVWGRSRQELYERPSAWLEAVHPEDRPRAEAAFGRAVREGSCREEYRVVRPDGSARWIRDRAFPIRDEQGRVVRIVGIAEDVTERREAEAALRDRENRLRLLVEQMPAILWSPD